MESSKGFFRGSNDSNAIQTPKNIHVLLTDYVVCPAFKTACRSSFTSVWQDMPVLDSFWCSTCWTKICSLLLVGPNMSTPRVLATWRPVKIPSGQFRDKFQATPIAGWWKRRQFHLILRIWKKSEVVWHLNKQFSKSLSRRIDFWIVSLQLLENQQKDLDFRRSGFLHQDLFKKKHGNFQSSTSWWFQRSWKILVKMGIFPK